MVGEGRAPSRSLRPKSCHRTSFVPSLLNEPSIEVLLHQNYHLNFPKARLALPPPFDGVLGKLALPV